MEIYRNPDWSEIAVRAATWELNPKITKESLAHEFKENPVKALKNYASIVSHKIENAIRDPGLVLRHVDTKRGHPWDPVREKFYEWFRPKAGIRYFVHIDIGIRRDSAGVAMVHREQGGFMVVDHMQQIVVPFGRDISIAGLREWVYRYTERGFMVQCVTYDGYQSEESRQVLAEKGYETDYVSVDKDTDAYDTLIELVTPEPCRISYYAYPPFIQELSELKLFNGRKYDHPRKFSNGKRGSKDVSDAVAAASKKAIAYELDNEPTHKPKLVINKAPKSWFPNYEEKSAF